LNEQKEEGEFLYHQECPSCNSSDGLAVYSTNTGHCFVCEHNVRDIDTSIERSTVSNEFKNENFTELLPISTKRREISPSIFKQYSYGLDSKGVHTINHYNKDGKLVAQKFRHPDKTFSWVGTPKEAVPFGMNLWRSGGKKIYITEGEIDCLSIAEAIGGKYPVISINNGANSAKKELAKHMEYLNTFNEVVLVFDNDDAGHKATAEVSQIFPPGKVSTVNTSPFKDMNEVLKSQGKAGVLKYYYEAKAFTPDGIVAGASLDYEAVVSMDSTKSYLTPFDGLNKHLRGLRKGELVTFTAGSGMGKTTLVREVAYDLAVNQDLRIGWVALEENTQRSALGFMGIHLDTPIHLAEEREAVDGEKLHKAFDEVIATDNIYFYDHWGSLDSDNLISKLRFLAVAADVDFIFLDHISIVVSGNDTGNERIAIDNLMTALRSLAEETQVGICIISHLRRPSGDKGFENGTEVTLSHLRGSGGIAQLSDAVVAMERDQQAATDSNVGTVRILKNRYTGETGLSGKVKYYNETGRLLNYEFEEEGFVDETNEEESDY
jgi:twinkle protein